jgi:hypothetical protein
VSKGKRDIKENREYAHSGVHAYERTSVACVGAGQIRLQSAVQTVPTFSGCFTTDVKPYTCVIAGKDRESGGTTAIANRDCSVPICSALSPTNRCNFVQNGFKGEGGGLLVRDSLRRNQVTAQNAPNHEPRAANTR